MVNSLTEVTTNDMKKLRAISASAEEISTLDGSGVTSDAMALLAAVVVAADTINKLAPLDGNDRELIHSGNYQDYDETLNGKGEAFYRNAANLNSGKIDPARIDFADFGQARGGELHDKVMTPLRTHNYFEGRVKRFLSDEKPATQNARHRWDHGFPDVPHFIQVRLVCTDNDGTYEPGDVIFMDSHIDDEGDDEGITVSADFNVIRVAVASNGPGLANYEDNTGKFTLNPFRWNVSVSALYFD